MSIPTNPITPGRKWLYDLLAANTVLTTTYGAIVYPKRPEEGTSNPDANGNRPPMVFLSRASSTIVTPVGTDKIDDDGLTDINIVGDRRTKLEAMDTMLNAVLASIHRTRGTNSFGSVSSCEVKDIWDIPYQVEDDLYPRYIVRVRTYAAGN